MRVDGTTGYKFARRLFRKTHLGFGAQQDDIRQRRFNRVTYAPCAIRTVVKVNSFLFTRPV